MPNFRNFFYNQVVRFYLTSKNLPISINLLEKIFIKNAKSMLVRTSEIKMRLSSLNKFAINLSLGNQINWKHFFLNLMYLVVIIFTTLILAVFEASR